MKFAGEVDPYLDGTKFSKMRGFDVDTDGDQNLERIDHLVEMCGGAKLIHVGFADHLPLLDEKIAGGRWLHKRLTESAERCIGVDIDEQAVATIQEKYGIDDIYVHDMTAESLLEPVVSESWDMMLMADVLEHIDNPVEFLSALGANYADRVDKFVIAVPNAFSLPNLLSTFKHKEVINTDHRYWFSPVTLAKVAVQAGFRVEKFSLCRTHREASFWRRTLVDRFPLARASVVMELRRAT